MSDQQQDKPEFHTPPVPVRGIEAHTDVVLTARSFWRQTIAQREEGEPYGYNQAIVDGRPVEVGAARRIAVDVSRTPHPLRELAASLVEFADQLAVNGLVPLGINVHTSYEYGVLDQSQRAVVVTTVRGVRREWVAATLEEQG
jgi:hypothetical protein